MKPTRVRKNAGARRREENTSANAIGHGRIFDPSCSAHLVAVFRGKYREDMQRIGNDASILLSFQSRYRASSYLVRNQVERLNNLFLPWSLRERNWLDCIRAR
jgi:hypothetical protein